jgi:ribosomal-protein-serine acetyltransferase
MHLQLNLASGRDVWLRPYTEDDVDLLFNAVHGSIGHISLWMEWCHANYSRIEAKTWLGLRKPAWQAGKEFDFAIVDGTNRILGGCGLNEVRLDRFACNLGYWVCQGETGQGIATAATKAVAQFGFQQLGLQRAEIVAAVGNAASQRVAEKAGAVREGIARRRLMLHHRLFDAVVFSLTPPDLDIDATDKNEE